QLTSFPTARSSDLSGADRCCDAASPPLWITCGEPVDNLWIVCTAAVRAPCWCVHHNPGSMDDVIHISPTGYSHRPAILAYPAHPAARRTPLITPCRIEPFDHCEPASHANTALAFGLR